MSDEIPRGEQIGHRKRRTSAVVIGLATLFAGCQSGPERQPPGDDHFFPKLPEAPRVQFLRSLNGSIDFDRPDPLKDLLLGGDDTLQYVIQKPFSVATWDGRVYVTDSFGLKGVNVFDLRSRSFYVLGRGTSGVQLGKPLHVFVDGDGYKYVSDIGRRQVIVFGPDDTYYRAYGDGKSFRPVSCVAYGDEVFILDMQKDQVSLGGISEEEAEFTEVRRDQVLVLDKRTGKPMRRIGQHGSGEEGFSFASFLAVDRLGYIYVSDFLNYRVVKMDRQGRVTLVFGTAGNRVGDFSKMKGVAVDRNGLIYVADTAFQTVQVFDSSGTPLYYFGGARAPAGAMDMPAGVWVTYDDEILNFFRDDLHPEFEPQYLIFVCNQLSAVNRIAAYVYGKHRGVEYPSDQDVTTLDEAKTEVLWRMPIFPGEKPASAEGPRGGTVE